MAATFSSESRLFGLDLAQWPAQWRAAGALLLELPGIRALAPVSVVRRVTPSGQASTWRLRHGLATPVGAASVDAFDAQAVELTRDDVLERQIILPRLGAADLAHAVQLEVRSSSPFPPDDTVHGFLATPAGDTMRVDLAITSRARCQAALAQAGLDDEADIWLAPAPGQDSGAYAPLMLRGWGEAARQRRVRKSQARQLVWVALVLALLAALAVTPTAFKRQQAIQAQHALDALQRQAAPQLAQREAMLQRIQSLQNIGELASQQLALPPVIDMLTRAVPDGAWLTTIRIEGDRLVLNGQADDAAVLVQRLAAQPGVTEVRLASPATRGVNDKKERFVIELHASAQSYGPVHTSQAAASAAESAP